MNFLLNRRVAISMLFLALSLLGYISYKQLPLEIFPNADLPQLYVQVRSQQEVTPEYLEQSAVIPLEGVISSLDGVERIESSVGVKSCRILVELEKNADLKYLFLKLTQEVAAAAATLPDGITASVQKNDMTQKNNILMNLQVRGTGGINRVREFTDQKVIPELENIDGIAGAMPFGGQQKSVEITLNRAACEAHNINLDRVRRIISQNMQVKAYSGSVKDGNKRYFAFVNAEYADVTQIEDLTVNNSGVRLRDIATVYYGSKEETSYSRVNGKESVSVALVCESGANQIDISHKVRAIISRLNQKFEQSDIEIVVDVDQAEVMEKNLDEIINLALSGALLAIFIMWIFLRNVPLVAVVALSIPFSVFPAFNLFYGYDISINSLTLVGIALAIGMLLDNSVVVLENIYRLKSRGATASDAVTRGTSEIWKPVMASTLTTIAVFLPFVFSGNYLVRLFGTHIGISIISTLSVSLAVALLLIPMAVYAVMSFRNHKMINLSKVSLDQRPVRIYLLLLKTALRNPVGTIVIALLLFFVSILGSLSVSINSKKALEDKNLAVFITMPVGSTLEKTDLVVRDAENRLKEIKGVSDVVVRVEEEEAQVTLKLVDDYEKISGRNYGEIKNDIENRLKGLSADYSFTATSGSYAKQGGSRNTGSTGLQNMMGVGEDQEYIVVRGNDFEMMTAVAEDLEYFLGELDVISSARKNVKDNQPEVHISFDTETMTAEGIAYNQVVNALSSFQKQVSSGVNFKQGSNQYEIVLKYNDLVNETKPKDKTLAELQTLSVNDNADVISHELQSFSDIFFGKGLRSIERVNQEKQIEVQYKFNADVNKSKALLESARDEVDYVISALNLPPGIAVEVIREESDISEFYTLIEIAGLLIYMILAAVFESFITPFVLLLSVPLAAIGSFLLLIITGNSLFNANTLTGFLILLGVVVNNGILLIDITNNLRKNGYRRERAILTAGLSRLRPILITALTTVVAMIPMALGRSEYVSVIGAPFAITVIGGLTVSTLLTLVFIPAFYNGLENASNWISELTLWLKIVIGLAIIGGMYRVTTTIDDTVWKMAAGVAVIIGVPGLVWFVRMSLRRANANLIDASEPIVISIKNLVKIYGRDNQFKREWKAGKKLSEQAAKLNQKISNGIENLIWQLPLLGFLGWFAWFYLDQAVWVFVVSVLFYAILLTVLTNVLHQFSENKTLTRVFSVIRYVARVFFPLFSVILFYIKWNNIGFILFVGIVWYLYIWIASLKKRYSEGEKLNKTELRITELMPFIVATKKPFKALKGVSLEIGSGMFGLLGPNGAGKSTLIRIICGIYEASYGKIFVNGIDADEKREELQGLIGYLPQEFGMYENMPAREYLDYQAILKGITNPELRKARIDHVLASVHMTDRADDKIGSFSGGMKQRIGIAQILLHLPRILVVDEPTAGLDPRERIRFRNLLVELSRERVVIFSTHIIEDISSSCNKMAVINKGEVLYRGTPAELTHFAVGHVWRFYVDADKFEAVTEGMIVVHHMREGDQIRVRCLSPESPVEGAENELPILEDAYLWLLKFGNTFNH